MKTAQLRRLRRVYPFALGGTVSSLMVLAGCSSGTTVRPDVRLIEQTPPYLYSDVDWAEVLQQNVHDGLVDYSALADHSEALQRYYALLSKTGPSLTPDQFTSRPQITAYWVNAYNALVLLAVLKHYPVESVYDLSLPPFEHGHTFSIDGRDYTLAAIEAKALQESAGDVRVLFAMSRAAIGTPRLLTQPLRASILERQLSDATAAALDDPKILRIDHTSRSIQVWQGIVDRQQDFLEYWRSRRRVTTAYLYNVLLEMASLTQRRALQDAVGYAFRQIPFDRTLNAWKAPTTAAAAE